MTQYEIIDSNISGGVKKKKKAVLKLLICRLVFLPAPCEKMISCTLITIHFSLILDNNEKRCQDVLGIITLNIIHIRFF